MDSLLADCLADVNPLWGVLMTQTERQASVPDELEALPMSEPSQDQPRRVTAARSHQPDTGNRDQAAALLQQSDEQPDSCPQRDNTSPRQSPRHRHLSPSTANTDASLSQEGIANDPPALLASDNAHLDTPLGSDVLLTTDTAAAAATIPRDHDMVEQQQPQSLEDNTDEDLLMLLQDHDAPSPTAAEQPTIPPKRTAQQPPHQSSAATRKRLSRLIRREDVLMSSPSTTPTKPLTDITLQLSATAAAKSDSHPRHSSPSDDLEDEGVAADEASRHAKKKARQDTPNQQQQQQQQQQQRDRELEDELQDDVAEGNGSEAGHATSHRDHQADGKDGVEEADDSGSEAAAAATAAAVAAPSLSVNDQLIYGDSDDEEGGHGAGTAAKHAGVVKLLAPQGPSSSREEAEAEVEEGNAGSGSEDEDEGEADGDDDDLMPAGSPRSTNAEAQRSMRECAVKDRIGRGAVEEARPLTGFLAKMQERQQQLLAKAQLLKGPSHAQPPPAAAAAAIDIDALFKRRMAAVGATSVPAEQVPRKARKTETNKPEHTPATAAAAASSAAAAAAAAAQAAAAAVACSVAAHSGGPEGAAGGGGGSRQGPDAGDAHAGVAGGRPGGSSLARLFSFEESEGADLEIDDPRVQARRAAATHQAPASAPLLGTQLLNFDTQQLSQATAATPAAQRAGKQQHHQSLQQQQQQQHGERSVGKQQQQRATDGGASVPRSGTKQRRPLDEAFSPHGGDPHAFSRNLQTQLEEGLGMGPGGGEDCLGVAGGGTDAHTAGAAAAAAAAEAAEAVAAGDERGEVEVEETEEESEDGLEVVAEELQGEIASVQETATAGEERVDAESEGDGEEGEEDEELEQDEDESSDGANEEEDGREGEELGSEGPSEAEEDEQAADAVREDSPMEGGKGVSRLRTACFGKGTARRFTPKVGAVNRRALLPDAQRSGTPIPVLAGYTLHTRPRSREALMADQREEEETGGSSPAKPSGAGPPRPAVKLARPKGQSRFIDTEAELSDDGGEGEEEDDEDGEDDGTLAGLIGEAQEGRGDEEARVSLHMQWQAEEDKKTERAIIDGIRNGFRTKSAEEEADEATAVEMRRRRANLFSSQHAGDDGESEGAALPTSVALHFDSIPDEDDDDIVDAVADSTGAAAVHGGDAKGRGARAAAAAEEEGGGDGGRGDVFLRRVGGVGAAGGDARATPADGTMPGMGLAKPAAPSHRPGGSGTGLTVFGKDILSGAPPLACKRQSSFVGRTVTSSLHKVGSSNLGIGRSYVFGSDLSNSHMGPPAGTNAADATRDPTNAPDAQTADDGEGAGPGTMTFAGVKSLTNLRNGGGGGGSANGASLFNLLGSSSGSAGAAQGRQALKPPPGKPLPAAAAGAAAAAAVAAAAGGSSKRGVLKRNSSSRGGSAAGGSGSKAGSSSGGGVGGKGSKGVGESSAAEDARMGEAMAAVAARFPTNVAAATNALKRR
ncbi:MAG: hypothetical protein WDW38_011089 [Sanguina aurantia]